MIKFKGASQAGLSDWAAERTGSQLQVDALSLRLVVDNPFMCGARASLRRVEGAFNDPYQSTARGRRRLVQMQYSPYPAFEADDEGTWRSWKKPQ